MAGWLSVYPVVDKFAGIMGSERRRHCRYIPTWSADAMALYSDSAVEIATAFCFRENQLTGVWLSVMTAPEIVLRSVISLAKSASLEISSFSMSGFMFSCFDGVYIRSLLFRSPDAVVQTGPSCLVSCKYLVTLRRKL